MEAVKQLLAAGQLQEAIEQTQQALKTSPAASDLRACLVELLCLAGNLDRADEVLTVLAKRHPDWIPGAANLRQLLRAQQARLALRAGQLADDVVATPGPALEALVAVNLHLSREELEEAQEAAAALEAARTPAVFAVGSCQGEIRDCDDSLNGYLEGLGTDGRFYLWQWSEVESLRMHPASSPVELVWRRAEVGLADGRQGEVFMPLTYPDFLDDNHLLGRVTDWQEHAAGLVTGLGQKLFLIGDDAVPFEELRKVERYQAAEAVDAV